MEEKVKEWFNEAKGRYVTVFKLVSVEFIIYKGFKLLKKDDKYSIQDVRFSNMYSVVNPECYKLFIEKGFIEGADLICFNRNKERVLSYKRKAELLYDKRRKFKKELNKDRRLNEKRIRNINRKIEEFVDNLFLYRTRINQYKIKYKLK